MQIDVLDENDVIASDTRDTPLHSRLRMPLTFRVKELKSQIHSLIVQEIKFDTNHPIQCQVLRPEQTAWKTGKIQIKLEIVFVEEEIEEESQIERSGDTSELDKLRSLEME